MGKSDRILTPIYKKMIFPHGETALLGFQNNKLFSGDLYDLALNNWNINSDWQLDKKYDTIISLRCPYFSKDPQDFIKRCSEHLKDDGLLYLDWGLGDHWRFKDYKIGWVKNNEQEYAYGENNYLWSSVWSDKFLKDRQFKLFCQKVKKHGYTDVRKAIHEEVPQILQLKEFDKYFKEVVYRIITLWEDKPQLYIMIKATKK